MMTGPFVTLRVGREGVCREELGLRRGPLLPDEPDTIMGEVTDPGLPSLSMLG